MSLIKYELLLNALEAGSITAASEKMGYTQSGVSHMLNSLEEELGVKLITRSRTGVKATATGEVLIPYIKRVVTENKNFMQALSEVTGLIKGKLIIGSFATVSTFYLPEIISEFQKIYPNIDFELKSGSYEEIEKWIENREVDCGFVSLPTLEYLNYIPVIQDRLVVVSGKEYPHGFSNESSVTLKELETVDHILIDGKVDYDIIRLFSDSFSNLKIKITTSDSYSAIKMIEKNLGVGLLPIHLISDFADVLDIFETEKTYNRTLALAYLNRKEASPILKKFLDFIGSKDILVYDKIINKKHYNTKID